MALDVIVGVPVDCTGRFAGCERAPAALRAAGLAGLGLADCGNLQVTIADPVRDAETGIIGYRDVVAMTDVVGAQLAPLLSAGHRPLVVGGCCSLLVGACAAARAVSDAPGLVFIDGHLDLNDGASSPTGEFADMELAVIAGRGPQPLTSPSGLTAPLIEPTRIAVLGPADRSAAEAAVAADPAVLAPGLLLREAAEVASAPAGAAQEAMTRMRAHADGFWLHVDLDVLSSRHLAAVDYRDGRGMDWAGLTALVRPLVHAPDLLGMDLTIYNPTLDPDGSAAQRIIAFLRDVLG